MWELTVLQIGSYLVQIYYWLMIAAIFATWIPAIQQTKIGQLLSRLTEPFFAVFRRFIPPLGFIDLSPLIALFVYRIGTNFALRGLQTVLGMIH